MNMYISSSARIIKAGQQRPRIVLIPPTRLTFGKVWNDIFCNEELDVDDERKHGIV